MEQLVSSRRLTANEPAKVWIRARSVVALATEAGCPSIDAQPVSVAGCRGCTPEGREAEGLAAAGILSGVGTRGIGVRWGETVGCSDEPSCRDVSCCGTACQLPHAREVVECHVPGKGACKEKRRSEGQCNTLWIAGRWHAWGSGPTPEAPLPNSETVL